ncbi:MAG: hypothetical protein FVQ82_01765 [Planctomycetes bacterium]|nr:hypothetical protein [Planctomycetota bacterium]
MSEFLDDVGAGRFQHEAMAAIFEIYIVHEDLEYAEQAARAAFRAIDKLEANLSRFVENSDISRINNLKAGHSTVVGLDTFECLQLCAKINKDTFGAFDITVGSLYKCWLKKDKTLRKPTDQELADARENTGMHLLRLDEDDFSVTVLATGVSLDLGAIGKGFALDKAAEVLAEWSISTAFLHSGGSTVLGLKKPKGTKGWPVTMSLLDDLWKKDKTSESKIEVLKIFDVHKTALSGSNLEVGSHVIEPRLSKPVDANIAAWAITKKAALADALSTSLLAMTDEEAKKYFKKHKDQKGMVISPDSDDSYKIKKYGDWK